MQIVWVQEDEGRTKIKKSDFKLKGKILLSVEHQIFDKFFGSAYNSFGVHIIWVLRSLQNGGMKDTS